MLQYENSWRRKIVTSRIFLIALTVHVLFVLFFGTRALFKRAMEKPDFEADGSFMLKGVAEENAPPAPPAPPVPQLAPSVPTMPVMSTITTTNPTTTNFTLPTSPVVVQNLSTNISSPPTTTVASQSLGALPSTMSARGASGRATAMARAGGKPTSEQAVLNALRWLQKVQNPDGSWGTKAKGAMTGFALLCYLGHGETPKTSQEFGLVVNNAINALVATGEKYKGVVTFNETIDRGGAYEQGIAAYALGEAYTMTKDERIAPVLTQAIGLILKGQATDGGWTYGYTKVEPSDTSVSGWQIQALKAAKLSGLPIEGLSEAMDNAIKNLDRVYDPTDGTFGYRKPGDHPTGSLTGVGLLCKLFWQGKMDSKLQKSVKGILSIPNISYHSETSALYSWYYDTQACFMVGGGTWDKWNKMFQDELVSTQTPDGNWPPVAGAKGGLDKDNSVHGQLYRTCLCTLMLEVYYRYLPTGKEGGGH